MIKTNFLTRFIENRIIPKDFNNLSLIDCLIIVSFCLIIAIPIAYLLHVLATYFCYYFNFSNERNVLSFIFSSIFPIALIYLLWTPILKILKDIVKKIIKKIRNH
jgi:hypothetical protein